MLHFVCSLAVMKTMTHDSTLNSQVHSFIVVHFVVVLDTMSVLFDNFVVVYTLRRSAHRRGLPFRQLQERECELQTLFKYFLCVVVFQPLSFFCSALSHQVFTAAGEGSRWSSEPRSTSVHVDHRRSAQTPPLPRVPGSAAQSG